MMVFKVIILYALVVIAVGVASTAHERMPFTKRISRGVGLLVWFCVAGFVVAVAMSAFDSITGFNSREGFPVIVGGINLILAAIGGWVMFKRRVYGNALFPPRLFS